MKRKSKIIIVVCIVFAAGVITGLCTGAFFTHQRITSYKKMGGDKRHEFIMRYVFSKLSLSETQEVEVRSLMTSLLKNPESEAGRFKECFENQKALIKAEVFDEQAFRESCREMSTLKENAAVQHALIKRKIRAVLNDEQNQQMDQFFMKLKSQFRARHHSGHRHLGSQAPSQ